MISHSKPTIKKEEIEAVSNVLRQGFISQGPLVRQFEEKFCKFMASHYAQATNSGTSALHLALLALKIKPADEIIIPSFVCTAVLNAVNYLRAIPKLVDINAHDFNINPESVENNISSRTKAIIVPHMFGEAADMTALLKFRIPIIEDCALSPGATFKNKKVGSFGLISIFSFYATKMMSTAEGGMVVTHDRAIYSFIADLTDYDNKQVYRVRYNYKMNELAAAMGIEQLKKLKSFILHRQKIAAMYNNGLADLGIKLPSSNNDKAHTYFRYIIRIPEKADVLITKLNQVSIEAKKPIFKPLHNYLGLKDQDYPVTSQVYKTALSLPIYPSLTDRQVKFIITKVRQVLKS